MIDDIKSNALISFCRGAVAQLARAVGSQSTGRGFDSHQLQHEIERFVFLAKPFLNLQSCGRRTGANAEPGLDNKSTSFFDKKFAICKPDSLQLDYIIRDLGGNLLKNLNMAAKMIIGFGSILLIIAIAVAFLIFNMVKISFVH